MDNIKQIRFASEDYVKQFATSDWSAVEGEKGHILNRTHWTEQGMKNVANAEYTTELTEVMDGVNIYAIQIGFEEKLTSVPNEIIFTYDNIDYNITFTEMDMGIIGGNMSYMNDFLGTSFENTNEPFLLAIGPYGCSVMTLETSPTSHLCKIDIPTEIVHQLDPKFIPIEEPVPSDWNASEGEPGYIINKPSTMPNPYTLYFTGAVTGSYNGSYSQTINIPKATSVGRPGTGTNSVIFNSTTNVASGNNSLAEGYYTKAIGENSHAEGEYSRAIGVGSHAEGHSNAIGENSHAEGYGYAYGDESHSEGSVAGSWRTLYDTITGEAGSLVYTITKKDSSLTQGMVLEYNNILAKIEYISNDTELHLDKTLSENEPLSLTEIRVQTAGATGHSSHSEGIDALAGGYSSHAEGRDTKALGSQSHAEGEETQALEYCDHAEGSDTIASGGSSHAEGSDTVASGNRSHAEGYWTEASGESSHAEGYHTKALGGNSHAEGDETQAIGLNSHAEGDNTIAQGESSHAEGNMTYSGGNYSHVEGQGAMTGIQLTGEARSSVFTVDNITNLFPGLALNVVIMNQNTYKISYVDVVIETVDVINKTITLNKILSRTSLENCIIAANVPIGGAAFGDYSHSEGIQTVATGRAQHVQGEFNIPDYDITDTATRSKYAHIVGNGADNDNRSNAHTVDWNGNAWFAGDVYVGSTSGTNKDEGSVKLVKMSDSLKNPKAITFTGAVTGTYDGSSTKSVNIVGKNGIGTNAEVFNALINNTASGNCSHAEGYYTTASGDESHAEGRGTRASGMSAHAEGRNTRAYGNYSHAEGGNDIAGTSFEISGDANATTYTWNNVYVNNMIKTGKIICYNDVFAKITAVDTNTMAFTVDKTLSDTAIQDDYATIRVMCAYGDSSHVEGSNTMAYSNNSHAEGNESTASGLCSHAEGNDTIASGNYSHAEGRGTTASNYYSHAEGYNTTASGNNSHAEGYNTTASGSYSHAEGYNTTTGTMCQHVQGKYNISDATSAHIVGNGSMNACSNAHTLDWDGNAWFAGDIYVGSTSGVNKDDGSEKLATLSDVRNLINEAIAAAIGSLQTTTNNNS